MMSRIAAEGVAPVREFRLHIGVLSFEAFVFGVKYKVSAVSVPSSKTLS